MNDGASPVMGAVDVGMDIKEFSGENVEAATAKAEEHYGLSREELRIKVVADETSGLYRVGMESRAVIVARPTPEAEGRARVRTPPSSPPGPPDRARRPGPRTHRPRREAEAARPGSPREAFYKPHPSDSGEPAAPRGPSTAGSVHAREILEGALSRLPIAGDVEVLDGETAEAIELAIHADSQGFLTGDEGETLAALTYLVNRMTNKGLRNTKRVVIEAEGFRSDQVAALEKLALDLAARVRTSGEPEELEPMNSYERRIVHMALQEASDIRTDSDGEGPYKRVIIRPADNS